MMNPQSSQDINQFSKVMEMSMLESDWLAPHHPILNGHPKSMNKLTLNETANQNVLIICVNYCCIDCCIVVS